jgi:hypothetical protein
MAKKFIDAFREQQRKYEEAEKLAKKLTKQAAKP